MKLLALEIEGFRGIKKTKIQFADRAVIVGPNGSGKSTIIDSLSLLFGRTKLVRELTEHDFHGSCPTPTCRIRIMATLGGFDGDHPDYHHNWFREGRAVPKWWNATTGKAESDQSDNAKELCAQIAFAARFDHDDLQTEQVRYFHDDDNLADVFQEDGVQHFPGSLFDDIGYYVLPVRRTWDATVSFASELFRKAVQASGGIPATTILDERDRLRAPEPPLESDARLTPLVESINAQMAQLLPHAPKLELRVTSTDSESLLRALVPHYSSEGSSALPAARHGTGLLSLQTFILLLEIGKERRSQGKPFILAIEEPELHVPPGLQRRLVAQAVSIADQVISTTHAPRVASFFPATDVQLLDSRKDELAATPLLEKPLDGSATNVTRKFFHDDRTRVVEALMQHRVLIPEGRCEYEWFRVLADVLETSERASANAKRAVPPFGSVVGVVPTQSAAVVDTYKRLRRLRSGVSVLVDGDDAGDGYITSLAKLDCPPSIIIQWPENWTIEWVVFWILAAGGDDILAPLSSRLDSYEFSTFAEFKSFFNVSSDGGRLKTDYLAFEAIASVIGESEACAEQAEVVLEAVTRACLGLAEEAGNLIHDQEKSTENCSVLRFQP